MDCPVLKNSGAIPRRVMPLNWRGRSRGMVTAKSTVCAPQLRCWHFELVLQPDWNLWQWFLDYCLRVKFTVMFSLVVRSFYPCSTPCGCWKGSADDPSLTSPLFNSVFETWSLVLHQAVLQGARADTGVKLRSWIRQREYEMKVLGLYGI